MFGRIFMLCLILIVSPNSWDASNLRYFLKATECTITPFSRLVAIVVRWHSSPPSNKSHVEWFFFEHLNCYGIVLISHFLWLTWCWDLLKLCFLREVIFRLTFGNVCHPSFNVSKGPLHVICSLGAVFPTIGLSVLLLRSPEVIFTSSPRFIIHTINTREFGVKLAQNWEAKCIFSDLRQLIIIYEHLFLKMPCHQTKVITFERMRNYVICCIN